MLFLWWCFEVVFLWWWCFGGVVRCLCGGVIGGVFVVVVVFVMVVFCGGVVVFLWWWCGGVFVGGVFVALKDCHQRLPKVPLKCWLS